MPNRNDRRGRSRRSLTCTPQGGTSPIVCITLPFRRAEGQEFAGSGLIFAACVRSPYQVSWGVIPLLWPTRTCASGANSRLIENAPKRPLKYQRVSVIMEPAKATVSGPKRRH